MTTAAAPAEPAELLPGYYVEPQTGAWLSLSWPPPFDDRLTIGPQVVAWAEEWLINPRTGQPWRFTRGQLRFLHLWYALQGPGPNARWLYRSGVKRGAKGTGKDPLLAVMALAELCGPTRPVWDEQRGRWIGERHWMALVQIGANSEHQAKDPLRIANAMVTRTMAAEYGFDKGITRTQLTDTGSLLELLTRSEASSEGDPSTAIFLNESHHMTHTSQGQAVAGVARRNVAKSPGGMARVLEFTNTHMPGEGSVAEDSYEAWQAQVAGKTRRQDILYDTREAPPDINIADEDDLRRGLVAAYGDSPWTDLDRVLDDALDPRTSVEDSVRFYLSSLPTAEDAWIDPRNFDKYADTEKAVDDGEQVTLFLDCSKSGDATVLVGCRIDDGHVFAIAHWQRPHGDRGKGWLAPREEVDAKVRETFSRFDVMWFGVDPSPARDDEEEAVYWAELVDQWHRDFREKLTLWATPGAKLGNAVSFDMRMSTPGGKERVRLVTEEAERTAAAVDDDEAPERFTWDGNPTMRVHVHNARRRPNQYGMSFGKQSRSSSKLVDYTMGLVGSRLGRRLVLNSGKRRRKRTGKAVF